MSRDPATERIRTPDQRLRVFVSSTLGELADERKAARRAVEQLRLTPVMFELGARPHPPRALYRSYLEQSDVFVGIYWQRYGWVAPDMSVSGLEDEYLLSKDMPRLVYVKRPAPDLEPQLRDMLARLQREDTTSYKPFGDAAELERLLADDLAILLAERFDQAGERHVQAPVRTNLPAPASELVGREKALEEVRALLAGEDTRLVTLTGTGGIGKTRLALEAARAEIPRFEDGVFFTDLSDQREPDDAYAAILRSAPAGHVGDDAPLEALKRRLQDRHALLVLDNFEQVEAAAPGVAQLLEHCALLHVLVTSRAALRIRGERRYPVPPLSLPPSEGFQRIDAVTAMEYESIRLFRDRAEDARPDFEITDANVADVVALCARLDALPLAIELAAARVTLFAVDELRARLEKHVNVLASAAHDVPERQHTLRRTIDWSYELLSEAERAVFQLFSVFTDAQVTDVEATAARIESLDVDVIDVLARLVDKSLVTGVSGPEGRPRFSMLQTIRDYAAERLGEDEAFEEAVRGAHAAHYTEVSTRLRETANTNGRESVLALVSAELGNLGTTWSYWAERGDAARLGGMLELLWGYYDARGNYRAALGLGEDLLAVLARLPETPESSQDRFAIETALARSLIAASGFSSESESRITDVLHRTRPDGDGVHRFPALRSLGWLHMMRSDFDKTASVARDLLAIADEQRDPALQSEAHLVYGVTKVWTNEMPSALQHVDEAVEYGERARPGFVRLRVGPDPRVLSYVVSGLIKWTAGYPDQALVRARRGVEVARKIDHPYSLAYAIFHAGLVELWAHHAEIVYANMGELLDVSTRHEYPIWRALAHVLRGTARAVSGESRDGLREVEQGVALYEGLTTPPVFWPILLTIRARAHLLAGDVEGATANLTEAEALVQPGDPLVADIAIAHGDLLLAGARPDTSAAEAAYERALELASPGDLRMAELEAATRLAQLRAGTSRGEEAARAVRSLLDRFTEGFSIPQLVAASAVAQDRPEQT